MSAVPRAAKFLPPVEDLVARATSWQLPPEGETACEDITAAADDCFLNSRKMTLGTDECHSISYPRSVRERLLLHAALREIITAPQPGASRPAEPCGESHESSKCPTRPFFSLMLPEWVHEKAAEDEATGGFQCRSLASFTPSPTSSCAGSPVSSCPGSPASRFARSPAVPSAPSEAGSTPESVNSRVRRSAVRWADLVESDDEQSLVGAGSTVSTASCVSSADSSPIVTIKGVPTSKMSSPRGQDLKQKVAADIATTSENFNSQDVALARMDRQLSSWISQNSMRDDKPCVWSSSGGHSGVRWVDLVESDVDPSDYPWQAALATQPGVRWVDLVESDMDPLDYRWSADDQ